MGERVRPFANGDEFFDWKQRNCQRCTLRWQEGLVQDGHGWQCDIEAALDYAHIDNGSVTLDIGQRMRFDGVNIADPCPERVLEEANVDSAQ